MVHGVCTLSCVGCCAERWGLVCLPVCVFVCVCACGPHNTKSSAFIDIYVAMRRHAHSTPTTLTTTTYTRQIYVYAKYVLVRWLRWSCVCEGWVERVCYARISVSCARAHTEDLRSGTCLCYFFEMCVFFCAVCLVARAGKRAIYLCSLTPAPHSLSLSLYPLPLCVLAVLLCSRRNRTPNASDGLNCFWSWWSPCALFTHEPSHTDQHRTIAFQERPCQYCNH